MTTFFFYGTLRHLPLLEVVLGRRPETREAVLKGHAVKAVPGETYPTITAVPGAEAPGLLVSGLAAEDIARLDYYEGGHGYETRQVAVGGPWGTAAAQVYFPDAAGAPDAAPWSLAGWVAGVGAAAVQAAREVMARRGRYSAEAAGHMRPFFAARAWGQQRFGPDPIPQTLRSPRSLAEVDWQPMPGAYEGFFRLQPFRLSYDRFDGGRTGPLERECFIAWDVALVLPYDPVTDSVLIVEQLRYGPIHRGDPSPWVLEPVAGVIDAGETPEEAALRETREEARIDVRRLIPAPKGYASPGYSTEYYHGFLALAELGAERTGTGGLAEENEDIRTHVLTFDRAMALVRSGEINALPLVMLLTWLAVEREGLRRCP